MIFSRDEERCHHFCQKEYFSYEHIYCRHYSLFSRWRMIKIEDAEDIIIAADGA